jgi:ubiquinone/menaquinone biosynthesis C-methylase UbiE
MGFYEQSILPRILNLVLGGEEIAEERRAALAGVSGRVLEVGFGSGLNLPWYGDAVTELTAIDPSTTGHALAKKRLERVAFPVQFLPLSSETIPADTGGFDAVVSTFTLCSIPDAPRALLEIRRVLAPGGHFYFLEHGRHQSPSIARWQTRLTPINRALGGGCELDRDIEGLVTAAGFALDKLERYQGRGGTLSGTRYRGIGRKATG